MSKRFTKWVPILMSIALMIGLAGCQSTTTQGSPSGKAKIGKITLRFAWWGNQDRNNLTLKMIKLFEKKNPNIKIVSSYAGYGDYWKKINIEAAGQNIPDVFQMDYSMLGEYTARKLIAPLNAFVSSGQINLKDVDKSYTIGGEINNQIFAIPLGMNAPGMMYDPEVFKKTGVPVLQPGYTMDDLIKTARSLKAKMGKDFYPINNSPIDLGVYLRERGAHFYNVQGTALGYSNDKILVDYMNLLQSLEKEGLMAPHKITSANNGDQNTLIVRGESAMRAITSNLVVSFSTYAGHPFSLLPPPQLSGGQVGNFLKPAMLISIASSSKHKEAAAKFINFFTNSTQANEILKAERGVPISQNIRNDLFPKLNAAEKAQFKYIEYVQNHSKPIDPPAPKGGGQVKALLKRLQDQVSYGQMTPENAAKQFRTQANQILSKNKK